MDAPGSFISSYEERLSRWPTGEAFLFFLVPLIEKGKKRYNQTPKGNEQTQYTYNYQNNFESCHNNAPPFLCNPAHRYGLGRLPPCHGYSSNVNYHALISYYFIISISIIFKCLFVFHLLLVHNLKDKKLQIITFISSPQYRMVRCLGPKLYLS